MKVARRAHPFTAFLVAGLVAALGRAAVGLAEPPAATTELERLEAENARLRTENERLKSQMNTVEVENEELREHAEDLADDAAPPPPLTTTVDAASGLTSVTTTASKLRVTKGTHARHWVSFSAARAAGQANATAAEIAMHLGAKFSDGIHRNTNILRLSVDGESFDCPVKTYRARPMTMGGTHRRQRREDELLTVAIPPAAVAKVEGARSVTGSLGRVEFALTAAQLTALRAIVRSEPAG
jgi:hypothetical protein